MIPPSPFYSPSDWINGAVQALAALFTSAVVASIRSLLSALGTSTEPDYRAITPAYDRMLGIALLLLGAVLAGALAERLLGGSLGGGWNLVVRSGGGVVFAFLGLPLVTYLGSYAALLAQAFDWDYFYRIQDLVAQVTHAYAGASTHPALGSLLGLIVTGAISLLLALVVHVELYLRAALLVVTATFLPFLCVLAIWPRFMAAGTHLVDFLIALLLSKFVIATAVYVGFALVVTGMRGRSDFGSNIEITGIAVLAVAALAPLALFQGVRFGHHAGAPLARSWSIAAGGIAWNAARRASVVAAPGAQVLRRQIVSRGKALGVTSKITRFLRP